MKTYGFFQVREEDTSIEDLDQTYITVPDMSFSVKEILTRFRRGTIDIGDLHRNDPYEGYGDLAGQIEDIVDLQDLSLQNQTRVSDLIKESKSLGRYFDQDSLKDVPHESDTSTQ